MTATSARALVEASGLREGDVVEWDLRSRSGSTDRGVVRAVTETRVYVRGQRTRTRGRGAGTPHDCEFWWDAHELAGLRKIAPRQLTETQEATQGGEDEEENP